MVKYVYDELDRVSEVWYTESGGTSTKAYSYEYDTNGSPVGIMYRDSTMTADSYQYYLFERNLQGDIVAIYSSTGTLLATYKYDAWGNHTVAYTNGGDQLVAVASNPFRYRGYYYDSELGLYYLNSRYYDSQIGRFINLDALINGNSDLIGFNLFAYCSNNPVVYVDEFEYAITYDLNEPDWWSSCTTRQTEFIKKMD